MIFNCKKNMKKVIGLIACFFVVAFAQTNYQTKTGKQISGRTYLGLKLGMNYPSMTYSDNGLGNYSNSIYTNTLFELFGEYAIIPSLLVRPGVKFITRGQYIDESGVEYEFNAKYTELTLTLAYAFKAVNLYPYLLGGPVLGFARGGNISYSQNNDEYILGVNNGNLNPYAFGLYIGAGVKYPFSSNKFSFIPGFEAGYHLGLTNTYSDKEINGKSNAVNAISYEINGTRKHRGFECGVTISMPISNFKRTKN